MRTGVIVRVTHEDGRSYRCRVKLDAQKFPYVIVDNEKLILNSAEFPRRSQGVRYGLDPLTLDIVAGLDELRSILANPELTVGKLSLEQTMKVG